MPNRDWTTAIEAAKCMWLPGCEVQPPYAWIASDGIRTSIGSRTGLLVISGQHVPGTPLAPDAMMPGTRTVSVKKMDELLAHLVNVLGTATVGELRNLCGATYKPGPAVKVECTNCRGTGEVECYACGHMHDCEDCDDGKVDESERDAPELRILRVGERGFDARYIAELLALVPDEPVEIGLAPWGKSQNVLAITGSDWTIRIAENVNRNDDTPVTEWHPQTAVA